MHDWLVKHGLHDGLDRSDTGPVHQFLAGLTIRAWNRIYAFTAIVSILIGWFYL